MLVLLLFWQECVLLDQKQVNLVQGLKILCARLQVLTSRLSLHFTIVNFIKLKENIHYQTLSIGNQALFFILKGTPIILIHSVK